MTLVSRLILVLSMGRCVTFPLFHLRFFVTFDNALTHGITIPVSDFAVLGLSMQSAVCCLREIKYCVVES